MRHSVLVYLMFLLSLAAIPDLHGQSMHVKDTSGVQVTYSLESIINLHFVSGELRVKNQDNTTDTYSLGSLRYLNFSDSTSVHIEAQTENRNRIRMYPNPVKEVLMVDLSEASGEKGSLHILGLDGKLVMRCELAGPGVHSVDLGTLRRGLYICRLRMQDETTSQKIYKQ